MRSGRILLCASIIMISAHVFAQSLKYGDYESPSNAEYTLSKLRLTDKQSTSSLPPFLVGLAVLLVVNPELVIENKKAYFGLTKELSIGKYPYGRAAFEYTYVFRNYDRNHLRFSYNQDFVLSTKGDFFAPICSAGIGYFTDTDHKGYFAQASAGIILPLPVGIFQGIYAYLKARHTFVEGKANSNITDFSLGTSFLIYY